MNGQATGGNVRVAVFSVFCRSFQRSLWKNLTCESHTKFKEVLFYGNN